jgi:hypothetical protein
MALWDAAPVLARWLALLSYLDFEGCAVALLSKPVKAILLRPIGVIKRHDSTEQKA